MKSTRMHTGKDNPTAGRSEILLATHGVSKRFSRNYRTSLIHGARDIFGELFGVPYARNQLRKSEFWALRDITFELRRGEAIGIVGRNGSGKTTLMRIIAGLINPTDGRVTLNGRLAPMLALGAGFNLILTGRENIYVNMSILGLSKAEIDSRFDEVVAFAEIEDSLDAPVQNFSTGMRTRLGFACAVHTSPDILLVDEVMSVGDMAFQQKCQKRIRSMREAGTSFLIVNHAPQLIVDTCQRAMYLKDGQCVLEGESLDVIRQYEEDLRIGSVARPSKYSTGALEEATHASHAVKILSCRWQGPLEAPVQAGEKASLTIVTETLEPQDAVSIMLRVEPAVGLQHLQWKEDRSAKAQAASVLVASSNSDNFPIPNLPIGKNKFVLECTPLTLTGGEYRFLVWIFAGAKKGESPLLDLHTGYFSVDSTESMQGSNVFQPRQWFMDTNPNPHDIRVKLE
jgi:lipopolysaccharide transport system ATP-binding protein